MEAAGMSWAGVAAIAMIAGFGLSFATFWLTFGGRIARSELEAKLSSKLAEEAMKAAREAAKESVEKIAIMQAAFGLYREQVAREYIHREVMREVEDRLTQAIDRLGDRLDRFVETVPHHRGV
jgi:biopolymer transport protein ExbB/TolQ